METYVTIEEAERYFQQRFPCEEWEEASTEEKEKAIATATLAIDRQLFKSRKTVDTQILAFPRYPDTVVPDRVKAACLEEALAVLKTKKDKRKILQREGVQSFALGDLSESYGEGAGGGLYSQDAREFLRPWLVGAVSIT